MGMSGSQKQPGKWGKRPGKVLFFIFVILLTTVLTVHALPTLGRTVTDANPDEAALSLPVPPPSSTPAPTRLATRTPFAPLAPDSTTTAAATVPPAALLPTNTATPEPPLPTPNPWDGDQRVSILLLGLDSADWESPQRIGPPRSDTMVLVSVDPKARTAAIISIPRDLWVDIPGMIRPNKINAAHRFGELYNLPGGGPALAARTVSQLLGVRVDYYARLDFRAFERIIDEIGGVTLDVPEEIKVDPIGPGNTVTLQPGRQKLDGPIALAYARNRKTLGSDFARSERQQQVMLAVRDQVLKMDNLPRLVLKAPKLYNELNEGIVTNLTLEQAVQLAWLLPQIDGKDIHTALIGPNQVYSDVTEDGQFIYVPIPERIHYLVSRVFSGQP
jgi:polyisoprenyl-teichoic acid--peptidoglycan teichoic acid transferase